MKSLLFALSALMLLASCQPSSNNQTRETLTQQKEAAVENEQAVIVPNASKEPTVASKKMIANGTQFSKFIHGFPQASLPLALNSHTSGSINDKQYISYDYERFIPEMAGERFSREVGKQFYYLAKISETEDYTTVIYAVKNVMMGNNAPCGYVLASYNTKGRIIDKMVAGGQINLEDVLRTASIQQDLTMEIKEYKQKWAKDPKEEGYFDNKIAGTTLKSTQRFRITDNGHFEKINALLSMR